LLFGCYRDTSNEEQRLIAIGRIILSWVIEKDDSKKAKNAAEADTAHKECPCQGLMESLQRVQQELYVVIDLIGTVGTWYTHLISLPMNATRPPVCDYVGNYAAGRGE
jgi:hypothetical protein